MTTFKVSNSRRAALALALAGASMASIPAFAQDVIKMGFVGALSGISAKSGEAITRGLEIAMDEINAKGGVLGRKLVLIKRDDESNPAKGQIAARELIQNEKVAVIFGGIDTPVAMAIVPIVNREKVPYVGTWAAGTPITRNGASPNYVFRVSAVDVMVDKALINYAMKTYGAKKPGYMLINNPWGESNEKGLNAAIAEVKISSAGSEKFEEKDVEMTAQLSRLKAAGADSIILVSNAGPAAQVMKSIERMNWTVPVISHWGISGGRFPELAGTMAQKVVFIQTYSYFGQQGDVGKRNIDMLMKKYPDIKSAGDIVPPVGYANAYDAMQLTALAIAAGGGTGGDQIREGFYTIGEYKGLIKTYSKPFAPANHDALNENDYIMVKYDGEKIVPVK
ncbi:MAG: ABC transporter substrate-binding protein [Casimicrobiaceae bacterium]